MISSNFIFNFSIFCAIVSLFLTKLLTLGFLVSTAVKPAAAAAAVVVVVVVVVVVAKLVMLGILFLILFFSASRAVVVVAKLAIVAISPLTSFIVAI